VTTRQVGREGSGVVDRERGPRRYHRCNRPRLYANSDLWRGKRDRSAIHDFRGESFKHAARTHPRKLRLWSGYRTL